MNETLDNSTDNENTPTPATNTKRPKQTADQEVAVLPVQAQSMELVDALLKSHDSLYQQIRTAPLGANTLKLSLIALVAVLIYGIIIGAFSGGFQWIAAPFKLVLGTALAALLCYPSLYIMSTLSGADVRPNQIATLLVSSIALAGVLLVGFAPVAFVFTFSIEALPFMGLVHLSIVMIGLYFGLRYLAQGVVSLGAKNIKMLKVWAVIFTLTLLQMSTTLRPILGSDTYIFTTEKQFFLEHWFKALDKY